MKKEQANQIKHFGSIVLTFLFILMSIASISEFFNAPKDQKGFCHDVDPIPTIHNFNVKVLEGLTGLPIHNASVEVIVWQYEYKKIDDFYCAIGDPKKRTYSLGTFQTNEAGEVHVTSPEITFRLDLDYAFADILVYKDHFNKDVKWDKLLPGNPSHSFTSFIYNTNSEP